MNEGRLPKRAGLDIGYVPAGPRAFFRNFLGSRARSGHNNSFSAGPRGQ